MREVNKRGPFFLAIKRRNNDYLPLEWNLTSLYNGEDLSTLEGIDSFTSRINEAELINAILNKNMVDVDDKFKEFVIIFKEKGVVRELSDGVCFDKNADFLKKSIIHGFLYDKRNDKQVINKIYNFLNNKNGDQPLEELKYILNRMDTFLERGDLYAKIALAKVYELDYENLRSLGMYIANVINVEIEQKMTKKQPTS